MSTDYITSAALKATLGITVTTWDADVAASISAASQAINDICQRRFYLDADATGVRYYTPTDRCYLEIADLVALTTLQTDADGDGTFEQTWTLNTDFDLLPLNAGQDSQNLRPWEAIEVRRRGAYVFPTNYTRSVKVTGQFGWPAVPSGIVDATTLLAERLFKMKREAPLGVLAFADVAVRVARADSNLMTLLGAKMRHRIAVG